jgi:hypothetical protein
MKKKAAKKNIESGIIENSKAKNNNDPVYIPLIDYVRENQLNYSKIYQLSIKGVLRSIRKGARIYIDINSVRNNNKRTVL